MLDILMIENYVLKEN